MSLYKLRVVARDLVKENEVRPYKGVDLQAPQAQKEEIGDAEAGGEGEAGEADLAPPEDLTPLLPLLLLISAREKAEEIVGEARGQAEAIKQDAQKKGAELGQEEVKKTLLPSLFAFGEAGQSLIVLEQQMISRYTPQMVRLALEIAEKIIGKKVEEDPEIVASILERAKTEVSEARLIRIRLHPQDYRLLQELRPELVRAGEEGGRRVEVLASEEIGRGGCRVETEIGVVDATLPTQIEETRRQILDEEIPTAGRRTS